jgi:adenylate cyclase
MFRRDRMGDSIRYFLKSAELMDTDFHSCLMLQTCYLGVKDEAAALESARRTLERSELALAKDPTNGAALAAGASSLIMMGEVERGKDWTQRALLLDPENLMIRYNVACSLTFRNSDLDGSLDLLEQYFNRVDSPGQIRHAAIDPDLDAVREHPRFRSMISAAEERLQTA